MALAERPGAVKAELEPGSGRWVQTESPAPLSRHWRLTLPLRVF